MRKVLKHHLTTAIICTLITLPAISAELSLKNPTFDSPILNNSSMWTTLPSGTGIPTVDPIPGWTVTGIDTGIFTSYNEFNQIDGMLAFIGGTYAVSGSIEQSVGIIQTGTYTFSLDIGWRKYISHFAGYNIQLLANNVPFATNNNLTVWTQEEKGILKRITVSALIPEGSPLIGQELSIRVSATSPGFGSQTNFDNATLEYNSSNLESPICKP